MGNQKSETDIKVPAGIHDIYIKHTNHESGSFSYIRFREAAAAIKKAAAPAASDMGLIAGLMALAASGAGFVSIKKKR